VEVAVVTTHQQALPLEEQAVLEVVGLLLMVAPLVELVIPLA
jgi:hypothetical protein